MKLIRLAGVLSVMVLGTLTGTAFAQAARYEVTSIKAIRPTLVNTIAALQKKDIEAAKNAFETYDIGWNGIEVYVNFRHPDVYKELEGGFQNRMTMGLNSPSPDAAALLTEAKNMLAKFDEEVAAIEKAPPISRLFDDVARLRTVRSPLRLVTPAIKAGNIEKARNMFASFDDNWDSIEELIKERSMEAYVAIESGMIDVEKALMPAQPNADAVITGVAGINDKYSQIVAQITKEARSAK
jgi:iron uptake system EfeUOB component EfeO/EfeM